MDHCPVLAPALEAVRSARDDARMSPPARLLAHLADARREGRQLEEAWPAAVVAATAVRRPSLASPKRSGQSAGMARATEQERALRAADKEHKKRVKDAQRDYGTAQQGVKLSEYRDVKLFGDRVEHAHGVLKLEPDTKTDVKASGTKTKGKDGKVTDSRELFLIVENTQGGFTAKCGPDDGQKVHDIAQRIRLAGPGAAAAAEQRREATSAAGAKVQAARADLGDIHAAESSLDQDAIARTRRRAKYAWVKWAAAAVVVLFVAVGVFGGSSDTQNAAAPSTQATTATTTATTPEPPDTGRLSGGEYDTLTAATDKFNKEAGQFGDGVGKCGVIASAGQLAEASSCVGDAFKGWDTAAGLAYSQYTDLIGASAKGCRSSLRKLRTSMDAYYSLADELKKQAENLALDEASGRSLGEELGRRRERFDSRSASAVSRCAPE